MQMMKALLSLLMLCGALRLSAQDLTGMVRNEATGEAVETALVRALTAEGKIAGYAYTDENGRFAFCRDGRALSLRVSCLGYEARTVPLAGFRSGDVIRIREAAISLKEVKVTSRRIEEKHDTLVYSVAGFTMPQDRSIADVIAHMPGFEVNDDGRIEYNGRAINKFYIEGLDLMNEKYSLASRNLDRRKVKSVEVLRNHQPVAALRGKTFSEQAAVNLVLEEDAKSAYTATADLGAGYNPGDDLFLHDNRLLGMAFKKKWQNFSLYKGNDTGDDVGREVADLALQEQVWNTQMESSLLSDDMPSAQDLPQERYLFNQSHLVATNDLHKLGKAATLRTQLSYNYNDNSFSSERRTDYYLSNDSMPTVREQNRATQIQNHLDASVCYELNSDDLYVMDKLKTSFRWQSRRDDLSYNDRSLATWTNPDRKYLLNDLRLEIPVGGKQSLSLSSSTSYNDMPQRLLTIDDRVQRIDYHSVNTVNSLSMTHRVFGFYLKSKLGLDYHHQSLDTELSGVESGFDGYLTKVVPSWASSFSMTRGDVRLEGDVRLRWWHLRSHLERKSRFMPEWGIYARYDINALSQLSCRYNHTRQFPDLLQVYGAPVFTGYRSATRNDLPLDDSPSHTLVLAYEYVQPVHGMFFSGSLRGNIAQRNSLSRTTLSGDIYLRSAVPADYRRKDVTLSLRASKSLAWWKSLFAINADYVCAKDKRLLGDAPIGIRQHTLFATASASVLPARWLALDWLTTGSYNKICGQTFTAETVNLKHRLDVHFTIDARWSVDWKNECVRNVKLDTRVVFSDVSLRFRHKLLEAELALNNIFGKTSFRYDIATVDYTIVNHIAVRPRELLFKVAFSL